MSRFWTHLAVGWLALAGAGPLGAAAPDAAAASAAIDRHIVRKWESAKVAPAAPADDAEFLRRVYLDLVGRIPTVTEARQFLDDKRPDRRRRLVEQLLLGPNYANHFTNVWRALLLPETQASFQARLQQPSFQNWLRDHLTRNTPYDQMVRELLTAPLGGGANRDALYFGNNDGASPTAFFLAKELMPENLAAAASRVFLGVKLECAQCHNHPFASWKREQFWSIAAFFAGVKRQGGGGDFVAPAGETADRREITIPETQRVVKARFLDGQEPAWKDGVSTRETLATWITRPDNPYFARATVNRMWAYFFGRGLIDPVDEMVGTDAVPSHPELLDELAKLFVEAGFDLKFLARAIVGSRAYQLSSRSSVPGQDDVHLFARMPLRGLTGEQLFDSLARATGYRGGRIDAPPGVFLAGGNDPRTEFLTRFASTVEKTTDQQTSLLQALALMNGRFVAEATNLERSELLAGVLEAPFLNTTGKTDALYLAALSRRPTPKETARLTQFLDERMKAAKDDAGREKAQKEAMADLFWALLNSAEFMLNH